MKKIVFSLIILFICSSSFNTRENQYLDFLKKQKKFAKDYVIGLFKNYDIVILCERDHKEFTQYELYLEIAKDPYFIENVGHIFTEVGSANMDDEINRFLQIEQQDSLSTRTHITSIFREISDVPYWHCYNYPWFLGELFKLNQKLNDNQKVMLHPSDCEFDWSKCKSPKDYKSYTKSTNHRDSIMAYNIIKRFISIQAGANRRKKALVIMNYKHAFLKDHKFLGETTHNTGRYLSDKFKGKVASVYIMGLAIPEKGAYTLVKNGKWDYYFETSKKTDVGFNLVGSPFGSAEFDVIPPDSALPFKYEDMFTGLIFYKPVQVHQLRIGWEGFASGGFIPELRRRMHIFNEAEEIGMTKEDVENKLLENNIEKTTKYKNLEKLRKEIDQWQNGL